MQKKNRKRQVGLNILGLFCLVTLLFFAILPVQAAPSWISNGESTAYGNTTPEITPVEEVDVEEDSIIKHLDNMMGYTRKHFESMITRQDAFSIGIDGIVLGRLAGYDISIAKFELYKNNPYGILGAYVYIVIRNVTYTYLALRFLIGLIINAIHSGSKNRAELKEDVYTTIIIMMMLYFMPAVYNILTITRDILINAIVELLNLGSNGLARLDLIVEFLDHTSADLITNMLSLAYKFAGFFYIAAYVSIALGSTGLFMLFPIAALLSFKNKRFLESWLMKLFSNLLVPLIDYVFLLAPLFMQKVLGYDGLGNKAKISFAVVVIFMVWSVIPARMFVVSIFGNMISGNGGNGFAALAMMGMRMLGGFGRGIAHAGSKGGVLSDLTNAERYRGLEQDLDKSMLQTKNAMDGLRILERMDSDTYNKAFDIKEDETKVVPLLGAESGNTDMNFPGEEVLEASPNENNGFAEVSSEPAYSYAGLSEVDMPTREMEGYETPDGYALSDNSYISMADTEGYEAMEGSEPMYDTNIPMGIGGIYETISEAIEGSESIYDTNIPMRGIEEYETPDNAVSLESSNMPLKGTDEYEAPDNAVSLEGSDMPLKGTDEYETPVHTEPLNDTSAITTGREGQNADEEVKGAAKENPVRQQLPKIDPAYMTEKYNGDELYGGKDFNKLDQGQQFDKLRYENLKEMDAADKMLHKYDEQINAQEKIITDNEVDAVHRREVQIGEKQNTIDANKEKIAKLQKSIESDKDKLSASFGPNATAESIPEGSMRTRYENINSNIQQKQAEIKTLEESNDKLRIEKDKLEKKNTNNADKVENARKVIADLNTKRTAVQEVYDERKNMELEFANKDYVFNGGGRVYENAASFEDIRRRNETLRRQVTYRNFDSSPSSSVFAPGERAKLYKERAMAEGAKSVVKTTASIIGGTLGAGASLAGGSNATMTGAMLGSMVGSGIVEATSNTVGQAADYYRAKGAYDYGSDDEEEKGPIQETKQASSPGKKQVTYYTANAEEAIRDLGLNIPGPQKRTGHDKD